MEALPFTQIAKALEDVIKIYPRMLLKIFGASFFSPRTYSVLQERIEELSIVDMQLRPYIELQNANLENAILKNVNFKYANLSGVNLKYANLEGANLAYANLEGADLSNAILKNVNFKGASLVGAQLEGADLEGAYLASARFKEISELEIKEEANNV